MVFLQRKLRQKESLMTASLSSFSPVELSSGWVRQAAPADADPLDALEVDLLAAESSGRLAQAVRQTVQSNRSGGEDHLSDCRI